MTDPLSLLAELVELPGPPGQEAQVREALKTHLDKLGYVHRTDSKGNLVVPTCESDRPRIIVTAHMDEIAMIVRGIEPGGRLVVGPLGGLFPWKLGEGPVQILGAKEAVDGVLSFGSIHTADPGSAIRKADSAPISWDMARVFTGQTVDQLSTLGVRQGSRVVVHPRRRRLFPLAEFVCGHFLDDRADLVSWLFALDDLCEDSLDAWFVATAAEEVGGEGAMFLMQNVRPDVCIALELAPMVADAPIELSPEPVLWVTDSYSTMQAADIDLVIAVAKELGIGLQLQALSRGGSDASCSAGHGLCARPFTLGIPMENSHGYEIIHPKAMTQLAALTVGLIRRLSE